MGEPRFENDVKWAANWGKRLGITLSGDDIFAALKVGDETHHLERAKVTSELLGCTVDLQKKLRQAYSYRNTHKGNGAASATPPATITELGEASNMFREYQQLLDKKATLEEKMREVDHQLEKYKPIANVIQSVRIAVKNVKDDLEVPKA